MPNQIVLSWDVDVTGTTLGAAGAAVALAAVPLYNDAVTDPVLGQLFGLTVQSDVTGTPGGSIARRVIALNMNGILTPTAPPPFPCHPRTSTPPVLPYPLRETKTLAGSFFVTNGSMSVATTATQLPALNIGDSVQFLAQEGVFYDVTAVTGTTISIGAPYSGTGGNTGAFKEIAAPVTLAALYSTNDLDTDGVATVPAIPAGSGARTVRVTYDDSAGGGPFTTDVSLTGRRPAAVALAGGSVDIAEILNIIVLTAGDFENSIGQITLVELSSALPPIPPNATPGTGIGAEQGDRTFFALTDEAQLLIRRSLAYLPPSFFALAQQGESAPQLAGDFFVTTGSTNVPTTEDQTAVLASESSIRFASQPDRVYFVQAVTPKIVTLFTAYTGIDENFTGSNNVNSNIETMGNLGTKVIKKVTGAFLVSPSPAAAPSNDQLSSPLGQFVALETASPPPNPPFLPGTVPVPTFLSGLFTRVLSLALAMPVTARAITFA